jgi:hypothetical protein
MVPLGTSLPLAAIEAALAEGRAELVSGAPLPTLVGRPLLVLFLCAHCPFVKHVEAEIGRLERDFSALQLLGIASNSTLTHPQDGPEGLRAQRRAQGWRFPYLFDGDQQLAQAFGAACTPDPFLYGWEEGNGWDDGAAGHRLVYRGQFDASRPSNGLACDGRDLRAAISALLAGGPITSDQQPAIGCNIKWRPGEEPEWAR